MLIRNARSWARETGIGIGSRGATQLLARVAKGASEALAIKGFGEVINRVHLGQSDSLRVGARFGEPRSVVSNPQVRACRSGVER